MKAPLRHFFDSMAEYFEQAPASPTALQRAHPGWSESPERVALYGRFVFDHVADTLAKLFPLTREAVGAPWEDLVHAYYRTRPARHFEMNQLGEAFPSFLADQSLADLPHLAPLARFEWTDFAVFAQDVEIPRQVSQLAANPTVTALEFPFRLCRFVRAGSHRPAAPEPGHELALFWRHPEEDRTYFVEADDRALLVLKLALEGISLERAVEAGQGVSLSELRGWTQAFAKDGLVLRPARSDAVVSKYSASVAHAPFPVDAAPTPIRSPVPSGDFGAERPELSEATA